MQDRPENRETIEQTLEKARHQNYVDVSSDELPEVEDLHEPAQPVSESAHEGSPRLIFRSQSASSRDIIPMCLSPVGSRRAIGIRWIRQRSRFPTMTLLT